ncbi:hypothetical protein F903_02270 [Acinetobacter sp. NIPH 298]|nr:hypothetical protein F903_02270 [Acinetobacter sp. NIPH 298]
MCSFCCDKKNSKIRQKQYEFFNYTFLSTIGAVGNFNRVYLGIKLQDFNELVWLSHWQHYYSTRVLRLK